MSLLEGLRDHYLATYGAHDITDDDLEGSHVIIESCRGEDAGMIAVTVTGEAALVRRLYVAPEHRGHGHGAVLVSRALATARELGARVARAEIATASSDVLALASRHGSRPCGPFGAFAHQTDVLFLEVDVP